MKTIKNLFFLFIVFFISSCSKSEEEKTYRHLRKVVIEHYQGDKNPLKIKAARFLLDNLKEYHK